MHSDFGRCAEKYAGTRFDSMAQDHWLEMGIVSFSFVIRETPSDQLAIEM